MKLEQANTMTFQQLADYAIEKLVAQGKQCKDDQDRCIYGDTHGNHCGIGWMLDPNDPVLMNSPMSVETLMENHWDALPIAITDDRERASNFQILHDRYESYERKTALARLQDAGLDTSNPAYQQWVEMEK